MARLTIRRPFVGLNQIEDSDPANPREASDCYNCVVKNGVIEKRPGYDLKQSPANPVRGLFHWTREDGNHFLLYAHGTALNWLSFSGGGGAGTLNSSTKIASFAAFADRVYIADGSAGMLVTDRTNAYNALEYPTTWADITFDASGYVAPPGKYSYTMTYYSTTWGLETNAFEVEDGHIIDLDSIKQTDGRYYINSAPYFTIPNITDRPDTRFDRVRVYRRKVDEEGTDWEYLRPLHSGSSRDKDGFIWSVASTQTFKDTTEFYSPDPTVTAPLQVDPTAYAFTMIHAHSGVMFAAGLSTNANRLYFSPVNQPWSIGQYITIGVEGDSDPITAISSRGPLLIVWKRDSIWAVSGNSIDTFDAHPVVKGRGAAGPHCVVSTGDLDYFWGRGSIFAFDGSRTHDIGRPVGELVRGRDYSRDAFIVGANDYLRRQVVWSYTEDGESANSKVLTYNYQNSELTGRHTWNVYDIAGVTDFEHYSGYDGDETFWFGDATKIAQFTGTQDETAVGTWANVEMRWTSQRIDGGRPHLRKRWKEIKVEVEKQSSPTMLRIGYMLDDDTEITWLNGFLMDRRSFSRRIARYSSDIRIVFEHKDNGACTIQGFSLEAEVEEEY